MKKFIIPVLAAAFALVGCTNELEERVDKLENRVETLESQVAKMQANIVAMQSSIELLSNSEYIVAVNEIKDGDVSLGWEMVTSNNGRITIYHGDKGDKGDQGLTGPMAGISAKLVDGVWYWTVNGELLVVDGKNMPVTGPTPEIRVKDQYFEVSYDGGQTWLQICEVGDNFFRDVQLSDEAVSLILKDGTAIDIPLIPTFSLVCNTSATCGDGETITVNYSVKGAEESDEVVVYVYYVTAGWKAEVADKFAKEGTISITAPATEEDGIIVVQAINNNTGAISGRAIVISRGVLNVVESVSVPSAGGKVEIPVSTNMTYTVNCSESWLTIAGDTKATVREETIVLNAAANEEAMRTAIVTITAESGLVKTVSVVQEGLSIEDRIKNAQLIFGRKEGYDGTWSLLTNTDYCILLGRDNFSLPCGPENLFDGDYTSKDGTWYSIFDRDNDNPVSFVVDMNANVAAATFYVQHFTDGPTAAKPQGQWQKKFKFYVADKYDGDATKWTLVAESDGTQNYMTAPDFDEQNEIVYNANGASNYKAYQLTYAIPCSEYAYGRYLKVDIYPSDEQYGKGKIDEIYMKGIYKTAADERKPIQTIMGPWEVLEGQNLSHARGKDEANCDNPGWYGPMYGPENLVDGWCGYKNGGAWYDGVWCSWFETPIEFPMTFVFDMGSTFKPVFMHVHDAQSHQGQYRNFDFYVADKYDGADTKWTLICQGRRNSYSWEEGGVDYVYDVTNFASGRYLKVDILDCYWDEITPGKIHPNGKNEFLNGRGYLSEIYFEGVDVDGVLSKPSDPDQPSGTLTAVYGDEGNGWKVLEGADIQKYKGADRQACIEAYARQGKDEAYAISKIDERSGDVAVANMFDNNTSTSWQSYAYCDNTFPIEIVVDMGQEHTPAVFHKVNSNALAGNYSDMTFYIAKEYKGADTKWEVAYSGPIGTAFNNSDDTAKASSYITGRYMKISFDKAIADCLYEDETWSKNSYKCAEIYFEEYK